MGCALASANHFSCGTRHRETRRGRSPRSGGIWIGLCFSQEPHSEDEGTRAVAVRCRSGRDCGSVSERRAWCRAVDRAFQQSSRPGSPGLLERHAIAARRSHFWWSQARAEADDRRSARLDRLNRRSDTHRTFRTPRRPVPGHASRPARRGASLRLWGPGAAAAAPPAPAAMRSTALVPRNSSSSKNRCGRALVTRANELQERFDFDDVVALAGQQIVRPPDAAAHLEDRSPVLSRQAGVDRLGQDRIDADGPEKRRLP